MLHSPAWLQFLRNVWEDESTCLKKNFIFAHNYMFLDMAVLFQICTCYFRFKIRKSIPYLNAHCDVTFPNLQLYMQYTKYFLVVFPLYISLFCFNIYACLLYYQYQCICICLYLKVTWTTHSSYFFTILPRDLYNVDIVFKIGENKAFSSLKNTERKPISSQLFNKVWALYAPRIFKLL